MLKVKIKLKDYSNIVQSIEQLLQEYNENEQVKAELLLTKARVMEKFRNYNEAAINYEQAAKYGSPEIYSLALFKLAKFRARQKDFYEALFDIKRIQPSTNKKIKVFTTLIDGV
jgi:tetratricopeptide (TPR) repeat protein